MVGSRHGVDEIWRYMRQKAGRRGRELEMGNKGGKWM